MTIRRYRDDDAPEVGRLIASTYATANLGGFPAATRRAMLGPFADAGSDAPEHRRAVAEAIASEIVLVAEEEGRIIGVLRGRRGRLASLFVAAGRQRRGTGSALVDGFEQWVAGNGGGTVKVSSTLFAVPFYRAIGYRRTTGVRRMRSFEGDGLPYQPMGKEIPASAVRSAG